MGDENRGFVFCLDDLDEVIQHKEYIEKLGYKLVVIKHFEDVIDAQSNAIMRGEVDAPVIFFINSSVFLKAWDNDQVRLRHLKRKYIGVILVFEGEIQLADRMHDVLIDELELPATEGRVKRLLRNAEKRMHLEIEKSKLRRELGLRVVQLKEMQQIGISLSIERDINKLMGDILTKARLLTDSDAGSMFLVDRENPSNLRFVKAQNDSLDVPFEETEMNLDSSSIAGCCVLNGELINIADVYNFPHDAPYKHDQDWDKSVGYRTKSILCIPMKKNDGETIGCIQLINRKVNKNIILKNPVQDVEQNVIEFDSENQSMISSFASQAAVAIDNSYLLDDIENLIEGLVRAAVIAIETRDPATSGHSERVADLSYKLAQAVNVDTTGVYRDVNFSEENLRVLKYASLLHDFGKVSVREEVLRKENKLFKSELDNLIWKIELNKRMKELKILKEAIEKHITGSEILSDDAKSDIEMKVMKGQIECDKLLEKVNEAVLPLPKNDSLIQEISKYQEFNILLSNGTEIPLVSDDEFNKLSINYGSLTDVERSEIEAHVIHTRNFLKEIPWTKDLKDIPQVAGSHHERNNGAGYPDGLIISEIPLESKIMAVADVFDSLTAWDRPYKDALPVEEALEILREEAEQNKLDAELVRLFIENKVYEKSEHQQDVSEEVPTLADCMNRNTVNHLTKDEGKAVDKSEKTGKEGEPLIENVEGAPLIDDDDDWDEDEELNEENIKTQVDVSDSSLVSDENYAYNMHDYSPFDETRTSLPQDFIEFEKLRTKAEEKAEQSAEKKDDIQETNLLLEKPVFTAKTPLEDNTDNVLKALELEKQKAQEQFEGNGNTSEKFDDLAMNNDEHKYDFTDETSIHVDLGTKSEFRNFVNDIRDELSSQIADERNEERKNAKIGDEDVENIN